MVKYKRGKPKRIVKGKRTTLIPRRDKKTGRIFGFYPKKKRR